MLQFEKIELNVEFYRKIQEKVIIHCSVCKLRIIFFIIMIILLFTLVLMQLWGRKMSVRLLIVFVWWQITNKFLRNIIKVLLFC